MDAPIHGFYLANVSTARRSTWSLGVGVRTSVILYLLGTLGAMYGRETLADPYVCAADPAIVAPCFDVRGRLSFANGTPSSRIWPVGTNRMLGVHLDRLPDELAALLTSFDTEVWANFTVCPYTPERRGHMRSVCIEAWRDISVRNRAQ